jgi:hypothetical protein
LLPAVWILTCAKNGISSYELSRGIGMTQKTAWFMLHRIREAISTGSLDMFNGPVEADETWIGAFDRNKHKDKSPMLARLEPKALLSEFLNEEVELRSRK